MELGLEGRVALVTGAARGLGAAIALNLASEGCDVVALDRDADEALDHVASRIRGLGRRALPLIADVRDFDAAAVAVDRASSDLGAVDILVANAGVTRDAVVWKMSEQSWDDVIDINLKGCFTYARALAPSMRSRGWGRIVAVSSINGLRGKFGQSNYAASKAGLIGLCKSLARELGRSGVTVNAVAPGMVMTDMARALPERFIEAARDETVLERLAEPQDVADAVAFLCSERARHITGEVLRVDGGQCM
jgi:3-oxoacyl-[acyl-carrier protein] reductase